MGGNLAGSGLVVAVVEPDVDGRRSRAVDLLLFEADLTTFLIDCTASAALAWVLLAAARALAPEAVPSGLESISACLYSGISGVRWIGTAASSSGVLSPRIVAKSVAGLLGLGCSIALKGQPIANLRT